MKIGLISNLYPPFVRGGAEIVAALQAESLKKNWQHVFVISSRPKYNHGPKSYPRSLDIFSVISDEVQEVLVYRFRPGNIYYYLNDFRYPALVRLLWHFLDTFNIFSYQKVQKILRAEKPELVITHNLMGLGFLLPGLLKKLKIKHIHVLHDLQLITPSGLIIKNKENSWEHKFFRWIGYVALMKKLWASPAVVISPSRYLLDTYSKEGFFPRSQKIVLPNPIKNLLSLPKDSHPNLELLYLGQVNKAKGALDLIKIFREIAKADLRLHIVGLGQDMPAAKKLAQDDQRIIFHGWLQRGALEPLLNKVDILVVPSLCYENSPTVIYEALSMGLPVLVADIGGAAELIREDYNGWIFPAGDFSALQNKIMALADQKERLVLLADNCRESVRPYQLDNYTEKLLEIINSNGEAKQKI